MSVPCHLVQRLAGAQALAAVQRLAAALASNPESRPDKRLQTLVTLYNVTRDAEPKFAVLLQLLAYAKASKHADVVLAVIRANSDSWAKDLNLSPANERALYIACADTLRTCTRKPKTAAKEAYRLQCKCLTTFVNAPAGDIPSGVPTAVAVVTDYLKSQDLFQFDLADNPVVKQLAKESAHAPLHQMLTIYLSGTVQEYQKFASSNAALLTTLGISAEDGLGKMRLLALMGLAHGASEMTFTEIQSALSLAPEEVEPLVVQALGKRLMEARIDQLQGNVAVSKCASRTFGPEQWKDLQGQLQRWAATVAHVREITADEKAVLAKGVAELNLVAA